MEIIFKAKHLDCLTLEGGTNRLSRIVGKQLPIYTA